MITVLILYGGNSPEHEVSIKSAKSILDNIDKNKFLVNSAYITKENEWINPESKSKITNIIEYLKTFDIIFEYYKPQDCMYIGDYFPFDVEFPISLGMNSIWKTNEESDEYKTIKTIYELKDIL